MKKGKELKTMVSFNQNLALTEKKKILQECIDYILSLPAVNKKDNNKE